MASGLVLDPRSLLRTAPVITSTCSLWYSIDQDFFHEIFTHPGHRAASNKLLPSYFRVSFRYGVVKVLGLLALTMSSGGFNILAARRSGAVRSPSLPWYTAGTVLAASHLLFVPSIAPKVQAIMEDRSKGQSTDDLEGWLKIHRVRTWTVDLAAWVCFVIGVSIVQ